MRLCVAILGLLLAASGCQADDARPAAEPVPTASPTPEPTPSPTPRPTDPVELAISYEVATPEEVAERIVEAETAIRSPDTPAGDLEEHARRQQAAYRQVVREPDWLPRVLELVPEHLHTTVQGNVQAGAELRAMTQPRDDLPTHWRIVQPPPPSELRRYYGDAEAEFGVPWHYLASIHLVETRMGRIRGTSIAGAQGPMQFMPRTWDAYGRGDINDPRDSILAAGRYLSASGAPADMPSALFAYNRSQRYVRAITLHAEEMARDERAYLGYYHWQVYYRTTRGDALLEVGWGE